MGNLYKQFFKFGIVGIIAFLIDYSLLYVFTEYFNIYYFYSAILSFIIAVIFNYYASIKWVFNINKNQNKNLIFMFVFLSVVGLIINQVLMYLLVEIIIIHYMISKIIATIVVMIWNFISRKKLLEN